MGISFGLMAFAMVAPASDATNVHALREIAERASAEDRVQQRRALWISASTGMPFVEVSVTGEMRQLARIEPGASPRVRSTFSNLASAHTIRTSRLWPGGPSGLMLTGEAVTLCIWDGGNGRASHTEFSGRLFPQDSEGIGDHATHVAGTMIARGASPQARGMAYSASLRSYGWTNDVSEMATEASSGLRVSNHSYGFLAGWSRSGSTWRWFGATHLSPTQDASFGYYDGTAANFDQIAFNAPHYTIVKAAGNDRLEGPTSAVNHQVWNGSGWVTSNVRRDRDGGTTGFDTLPSDSTSKNVLIVGAVDDLPTGWASATGVRMSAFSNFGPTDDGRIKPDLVANGVSLLSPVAGGDTLYETMSGTSMASPSVAGSIGLLIQHHRMLNPGASDLRSSTIRGLLIHTADEAGLPGPDYSFGWGLANFQRAAELMTLDTTTTDTIQELTLSQGQTTTLSLPVTRSRPVRVTIAWIDPAATPLPRALNNRTPRLVNDLDLRVVNGSSTMLPWRLNPASPATRATNGDNSVDNVEQIVATPTANGTWTIRIAHKGSLSGGSQAFSLIITR